MRNFLFAAIFFLLLPCRATWYENGVPANSDIVMADLRWPYWPCNTYFANWNARILPEGKVSFYAGYAAYCGRGSVGELPDLADEAQQSYHPEWVWSFWGGNTTGRPPVFLDLCEAMHASNSAAGEGAACVMPNRTRPSPDVNVWTTFITRVWTDPVDGKGRVGRWARDQHTGVWTAIGIVGIDQPATGLSGNAGFVETVGNPPMPRTIERKNGFARSAETGAWTPTPNFTVTREAPVALKLFTDEEEEYIALQYAGTPKHLPFGEKMKDALVTTGKDSLRRTLAARQPNEPPALRDSWSPVGLEVASDGKGFVVTWTNDSQVTPLFSIRAGKILKTVANCDATGCVRFDGPVPDFLVAENLLGVLSTQMVCAARIPQLVPQSDSATSLGSAILEEGLEVRLDELATNMNRVGYIPDLETFNALRLGENAEFNGYLKIAEEGLYIFRVRSDGGFVLALDGRAVLDRSPMHGSTVYSVPVNLVCGLHKFSFKCFKEKGVGGHLREIEWEGPSFARRPLSRHDTCRSAAALPIDP